jgi:Zn-dependent protease
MSGATDGANTNGIAKAAGILTPLVILATKLKSLLVLLKFGKIATTLLSMLVFIWADAQLFGWKFGVGIAVCIFIHEMGHVFVNWRYKLPQSAPVFIPFLGAAIFLKGFPDNPQIQAESGAGGPVAGFLAAIGCYLIYMVTQDPFWLALAHFGFAINLFNLIPFPPLDGSHIHTVFSPGIWNAVLVTLLLWAIKLPGMMVWVILIASALIRLAHRNDGRYLLAPPRVRARMAVLYLTLCLSMSWAADGTTSVRPPSAIPAAPVSLHHARETDTAQDTSAVTPNSGGAAKPKKMTHERIAPQQETLRQDRHRLEVLQQPLLWGGAVFLLIAVAGLWCGSLAMLTKRQNRAWTSADSRFIAGMLWLYPLLVTSVLLLPLDMDTKLGVVGAYFAGTLLAFGYALFRLLGGVQQGSGIPTASAFRMHLTAAFAFGNFLVGYATSNLVVLGLLVFGIVVFYARHRWMVPATLGRLFLQLGDYEKGMDALTHAAMNCPEPQEKVALWGEIARRNIVLYRGDAALAAYGEQDMVLLTLDTEERATLSLLGDLDNRAVAFGLTDHFADGLVCCEKLLRTAGQDAARAGVLVPLAEWMVHLSLARFAHWRGWHDEAVVQADWCLKRSGTLSAQYLGYLHALKAEALLALSERVQDPERKREIRAQAQAIYDIVEKQGQDTGTCAYVAVIGAQMALISGDNATAQVSAKRALDLLPGHLACRYWYGRIVDPTCLASLAAEFPNDHWGRLAAQTR